MRTLLFCFLLASCGDPVEVVSIVDHHQHPSALVYRHDGSKDGPITLFWPDGDVQVSGQYRDDRREGWWRSYHPNGSHRSLTRYAHGSKDGLRIFWDSLGRPMRSEVFSHGVPNGPFYRFGPDGRSAQRSNYLNGLLEGPHDQWYTDRGGSRVNGYYHLGREEGVWTEYDTTGRMLWQAYLKDGEVTRAIHGERRWH